MRANLIFYIDEKYDSACFYYNKGTPVAATPKVKNKPGRLLRRRPILFGIQGRRHAVPPKTTRQGWGCCRCARRFGCDGF